MKNIKKELQPNYKNELSIFERKTLDELEVFRAAREKWITNNMNQKTHTKVKEGLNEPNIYNGRCYLLRKIRLKTTRLRAHFQDLRPLKYYTLKRKLTHTDVDSDVKKLTKKEQQKAAEKEGIPCESLGSDYWMSGAPEAHPAGEDQSGGREKEKWSRRECVSLRTKGPTKKALRRLKAAKLEDRIIESCRCDDGREVTVVIKGICLCDKSSLNNINLNRVCDEYSRLVRPELRASELPSKKEPVDEEEQNNLTSTAEKDPEPKTNELQQSEPTSVKEKKPASDEKSDDDIKRIFEKDSQSVVPKIAMPSTADSLEIHRKSWRQKSKTTEDMSKDEIKDDTPESVLRKKVGFDVSEDFEKNRKGLKFSEITLYRKLSKSYLDVESEDEAGQSLKKTEKPAKEHPSEHVTDQHLKEENKFTFKNAEEQESKLEKTSGSDLEDLPPELTSKKGTASTITLYKNEKQMHSSLGLTNEQMDVIKKVEAEKNQNPPKQ